MANKNTDFDLLCHVTDHAPDGNIKVNILRMVMNSTNLIIFSGLISCTHKSSLTYLHNYIYYVLG